MESIKMLMVDSSMFVTQLDILGYKRMGLSVKCADNFKKIDAFLHKEKFDVIVMNLDYEDVDYVKLGRYIRENPSWKDLLIVLTSVRTGGRVKEIYDSIDADLFVSLPVPKEIFIEKIKSLLDQVVRNTVRVKLVDYGTIIFKGEKYDCIVDDLSSSGVSLLVKQEFLKDETLSVKFNLYLDKQGKHSLDLKAKIKRVSKMDFSKIEYKEDYSGIENIQEYKYFMGVCFEYLKEEDRRTIEKYIAIVTKSIDKMTYYI